MPTGHYLSWIALPKSLHTIFTTWQQFEIFIHSFDILEGVLIRRACCWYPHFCPILNQSTSLLCFFPLLHFSLENLILSSMSGMAFHTQLLHVIPGISYSDSVTTLSEMSLIVRDLTNFAKKSGKHQKDCLIFKVRKFIRK